MNSKSRYELAASVCRGKVWLDNTALTAISRMYRKRIENATSKLKRPSNKDATLHSESIRRSITLKPPVLFYNK